TATSRIARSCSKATPRGSWISTTCAWVRPRSTWGTSAHTCGWPPGGRRSRRAATPASRCAAGSCRPMPPTHASEGPSGAGSRGVRPSTRRSRWSMSRSRAGAVANPRSWRARVRCSRRGACGRDDDQPGSGRARSARLPGLPAALDEATMASLLGRTLHPGGHRIALCRVRSIRYLPGRGCVVRYDAVTGADTTVTVTARVHPSAAAARREHADRLRPLAHRLGAPGTIAVLPGLRATVSVYPIDAGLPTLLDATDRARAGPLLADSFGRRPLSLEVTTHRYRGADRVMLRYDEGGRTLAYGKVAADDRGEHANAALTAAARVLALLPADRRFDVPRPLGYAPPLRLQLLGVVPGAPVLSDLLRACARGAAPPAPALSAAVAGCAEVAAALHELALPPAGRRSAEGEIRRLHSEIASVARIAPSLGGWLENRLAGAAAELSASAPLAAVRPTATSSTTRSSSTDAGGRSSTSTRCASRSPPSISATSWPTCGSRRPGRVSRASPPALPMSSSTSTPARRRPGQPLLSCASACTGTRR